MAVSYCQLNASKCKDHTERYMAGLPEARIHLNWRAVALTARPDFFVGNPLFELHVSAAASRIDSNAVLRGRNADYHTGLI
jgi:hypothetical protein